MKDYSGRYSANGGKRQKVLKRSMGRPGERNLLWRVTGMIAMVAMIAGFTASLWFGYQINSTLDELAMRQEKLEQARERNSERQRLQEELLSSERVRAAAAARGLHPPAATQIRKM